MLVGQSTAEYILIRAITYYFSYLGIICLVYFYLAISIGGVLAISHPILFYLFWFIPYRHHLHKQSPVFPPPLSCERRQALFKRSLSLVPDTELFVKKWMCMGNVYDMRRENLKEWLLWALFDREGLPSEDDKELEEYVVVVEEALGRTINPGYGPVKSLRLNFDNLTITHRTLTYYMFIGFADFLTSVTLLISGFTFYRLSRASFLSSFPFRPLTLFSPSQSASPTLSYFIRPHKSTTHRPIVFAHGLGIGLLPYIPLFRKIPKDIGILAIELLPISSRITTAMPLAIDLKRELGDIISQQSFDDFVFIGNSYGTFLTKLFLESAYLESRMHSVIMLDPVALLLHLPDVAYFCMKIKPVEANEWQLWWAALTEPDIMFTLSRRFCWHEHAIWREDLLSRPTSVIMGSKDCIVNPEAIASYVASDGSSDDSMDSLQWTWRDREEWKKSLGEWKGDGLELAWLEGYDHGQGFMSPKMLPKIAAIVERSCGIKKEDNRSNESIE
ncbi:hypothetical protein B0J11DRAFT_549509 [Dendryphion nanum]|uniref:AB hydrolase-1 domain-containing protein n=1 Tax=Dendryphion nanum TaxID=256645 RepID=A0A9P9DX14_9PLEO|nr:hypothetical protein B0J11DRAFT_549509 [Dendryphion nanum]